MPGRIVGRSFGPRAWLNAGLLNAGLFNAALSGCSVGASIDGETFPGFGSEGGAGASSDGTGSAVGEGSGDAGMGGDAATTGISAGTTSPDDPDLTSGVQSEGDAGSAGGSTEGGSSTSDLGGTTGTGGTGCAPGWLDCDPDQPGCETPSDAVTSCGSCERRCSVGSWTVPCDGGSCSGAITVTAFDDAYIDEGEPDETHDGADLLVDGDSTNLFQNLEYRTLLRPLDLADLPDGTVIESARLRLYAHNEGDSVSVREILEPWEEGSVTWDNRPGSSGSLIESFTPGSSGAWYDIDLTERVQSWVDDQTGGHGVELSSSGRNGSDYRSSEAGSNGPRLELTLSW